MDLPAFALFMEELARVDGAFAWCVNLGAGANLFSGFMEPSLASELFADSTACVAGSGMVSGMVVEEGSNYRVNGTWKYASGAAHATLFSLNAPLSNQSGTSVVSFLIPKSGVLVQDTWHVLGLKASGSNDFEVPGTLVPKDYAFSLLGPSKHQKGTLYRFPFMVLAEINMLVMLTGLCMRFAELSFAYLEERKASHASSAIQCFSDFKRMNQACESAFLESRKVVFKQLERIWQKVSLQMQVEDTELTEFSTAVNTCAQKSREWVDALYPFLGMEVVFGTELNRVWRDFKTGSQHALLRPMLPNSEDI